MYPPLVGFVTVRFTTTAETPDAGTPPAPAICRRTTPYPATAAFTAPTPARVSNTRAGDNDTNAPGSVTATEVDALFEVECGVRGGATAPPAVAAATGLAATSSSPTATPSTDRKLRARATAHPSPSEIPSGIARMLPPCVPRPLGPDLPFGGGRYWDRTSDLFRVRSIRSSL